MTDIIKNFFDPEKLTAAGHSLVSDQLKLINEGTKSAAAEVEHFTSFVTSLATLKTGDEIANAAVSYWSNAGLRSLVFAGQAKERFENATRNFA